MEERVGSILEVVAGFPSPPLRVLRWSRQQRRRQARREPEVGNAIVHIYDSAKVDREMQISGSELKSKLDASEEIHLIDVREDWEIEIASLANSEVISQKLAYEILNKWDKNSTIVFICHHGQRSLEAASYFKGHGLPNVKSLTGGLDIWAQEIDKDMKRY